MIDTEKYEGHYKGPWANQYGDVVKLVYPNESSPSLDADQRLITDAPLLLEEVKRLHKTLTKMQQDTLKVVTEWFDVYGGDENEWRRLEQALDLPLTPLSWEAIQ
jgi:hypothetical protein